MIKKYIPIAGDGYTKDFFEVNLQDEDLQFGEAIEVEPYHSATIAFRLQDDGLKGLGIEKGDYLLFSPSAESYKDQVLLVRTEGKYIIRIGTLVTPESATLTTAEDVYPTKFLCSENIRVIGVMNAFIKPYDELRVVNMAKMEELYH